MKVNHIVYQCEKGKVFIILETSYTGANKEKLLKSTSLLWRLKEARSLWPWLIMFIISKVDTSWQSLVVRDHLPESRTGIVILYTLVTCRDSVAGVGPAYSRRWSWNPTAAEKIRSSKRKRTWVRHRVIAYCNAKINSSNCSLKKIRSYHLCLCTTLLLFYVDPHGENPPSGRCNNKLTP